MEPVFSGVFAVYVGHEHLTIKMFAGGALVLLAMYLVELGPKKTWQDVTRANH
jgi:drug/metabolite transporter (DMT)-like permease